MSNYQNQQNPKSFFNLPYVTKRPELQEAFDSLPPLCAVWVEPHQKNRRGGSSYADVALVRDDGLAYVITLVINRKSDAPFDLKEAAIRNELMERFRHLTGDKHLLFYDADKGIRNLNAYVSPDAVAVCLKQSLAQGFAGIDECEQNTISFNEAMKRIGIPSLDTPHPALTKATRLLHAWYHGVECFLGKKYRSSFQ